MCDNVNMTKSSASTVCDGKLVGADKPFLSPQISSHSLLVIEMCRNEAQNNPYLLSCVQNWRNLKVPYFLGVMGSLIVIKSPKIGKISKLICLDCTCVLCKEYKKTIS